MDSREIARKFLELELSDPSLEELLELMVEVKGSDLHLSCGSNVMVRVRNKMHPLKNTIANEKMLNGMIESVISDLDRSRFKEHGSVDFSFRRPDSGIFRVNVFKQHLGPSMVIRNLPAVPPSLKSLRMPSILTRSLDFPNGLILVTGPTGSGKSTTLAAMLDHLNRKKRGHIVTLEDPIEYVHNSKKCMVNQRAYNKDFYSFSDAITHALREDPDYILVGEMRDLKTISAAIKAAETGHLVFSTLHTNSASKTVDRILGSFPAGEQNEVRLMLAETLRMVVSQKLIASSDGSRLQVFQDILINNSAVANLIREGKTYQIENIMATSRDEGMQLMDKRIRAAAEQGDIRVADAKEKVNDKKIMDEIESFINKQPDLKEYIEDVYEELVEGEDEEFNYEDELDNPYATPEELAQLDKEAAEAKAARDAKLRKREMDSQAVLGLKDIVEELKSSGKKRKVQDVPQIKKSKKAAKVAPPPPPKKNRRGVEVEFERIVNETYEFDKISTKGFNILLLNFEKVRRISDGAVTNLVKFMNRQKADVTIKIKGLHPSVIKAINKITKPGYFTQYVIENFYAPYYCGNCDLELAYLLEYGKDFHSSKLPELPEEVTCSECHDQARLNIDADFLDFLRSEEKEAS